MKEIERKFIISNIPKNLEIIEKKFVEQNYLLITKLDEIRLRKEIILNADIKKENYTLTKKSGFGLIREEEEHFISEKMYNLLKSLIEKKPILKKRQIALLDKDTDAVIDEYIDKSINMKTIEIEFNSIENANNFKVPKWFGAELTNNEQFKNKNIWKALNKREVS